MPELRRGHSVELLHRGAEFFPALIAAMDASVQEVRLETYIFHFDSTGEAVAAALARAGARGVAVYVVMDGIGTPSVPDLWQQRFAAAGVRWHRFSPLGVLGLLVPGRWRRMHRKLCVVDGTVAFCGGINVLDDYFEFDHGMQETPRFDFAVRVRGPLVADVQATMEQFWKRLVSRGRVLPTAPRLASPTAVLPLATPLSTALPSTPAAPFGLATSARAAQHADMLAALMLRDNLRNRSRIERAYRKTIAHAKQEVVIANAYFLPGGKLRRALIHAVRRGVRVQLLLHGRYEYFMQFHGTKPIYDGLLEAGVEIYEYHAGFLHAKVAVIDGVWATVGSSNLDPLSLLLAREANVVVRDASFAQQLLAVLQDAIAHASERLEVSSFRKRPWLQRFTDHLAYGLMRLTLFLTGRDY